MCLAGVKVGAFTCVGWQATRCDPIWQVTLSSSRLVHTKSYTHVMLLMFSATLLLNSFVIVTTLTIINMFIIIIYAYGVHTCYMYMITVL